MNLTEREKEFLKLLHTLTKEQKDEYIRYLQRLVKEDPDNDHQNQHSQVDGHPLAH